MERFKIFSSGKKLNRFHGGDGCENSALIYFGAEFLFWGCENKLITIEPMKRPPSIGVVNLQVQLFTNKRMSTSL